MAHPNAELVSERTSLVGQLLGELLPFAPAPGPLPDPTPAEGPDPYGDPDPDWLRVDWRAHLHQAAVSMPGEAPREEDSRHEADQPTEINYVELGAP